MMHAGRMSHPDNTPHRRQAVAPSAVAPGTQMFTATGMQDIPTPRALTTEEVRLTVADFRTTVLRRGLGGQSGTQWFFTEAGRPFSFYAVLGSHALRPALVPHVNTLLSSLTLSPAAVADLPAARPQWN